MVSLSININSENSALVDNPREEACRLLKRIAQSVANGNNSGRCLDINGNCVGHWYFETEDEDEGVLYDE